MEVRVDSGGWVGRFLVAESEELLVFPAPRLVRIAKVLRDGFCRHGQIGREAELGHDPLPSRALQYGVGVGRLHDEGEAINEGAVSPRSDTAWPARTVTPAYRPSLALQFFRSFWRISEPRFRAFSPLSIRQPPAH